jgi:AcrR family transcriptional regulator
MPRLIEPEGRTNTVVDAMNFLLSRDGPGALTLRTISRESRVSTSSLLHHFGSRDELLRVAASWTGRARAREIDRRSDKEGVGAFLPGDGDDEDLITARAWLNWCALWRSTESLVGVIEDARDREAVLLAQVLGLHPIRDDLTALIALIYGLTEAVCAPVHALRTDEAREILRTHAEARTRRAT